MESEIRKALRRFSLMFVLSVIASIIVWFYFDAPITALAFHWLLVGISARLTVINKTSDQITLWNVASYVIAALCGYLTLMAFVAISLVFDPEELRRREEEESEYAN